MATLDKFQSEVVLGKVASSDLGYGAEEVTVTWTDGMGMGSALVDGAWATAATAANVNGVLIDPEAESYDGVAKVAGQTYTMVVAKRGYTINSQYFNILMASGTTQTDVDNAIAAFEAAGANKVTDKYSSVTEL